MGLFEKARLLTIFMAMRQRRIRLTPIIRFAATLAVTLVFAVWGDAARAQGQTDWRKLEQRLPSTVVVDPGSADFGYRFETMESPAQVPQEFLTGGAAAKNALRSALAAGRVDSLVALTLLVQLKDRQAAQTLSHILTDPKKLARYAPPAQAAIPLVLRYHLSDTEWPGILITALGDSPTDADSAIIACLSRFDFPAATEPYKHALPHVDLYSQTRIIDRLASNALDGRVLWELFGLSGGSGIQNIILDRLEGMQSPHWPAQADSLAHLAFGDAACRVLRHASPTDTAVYRPLMRNIIAMATDKECVINAALRLSAEGDTAVVEMLKYRFHESDLDLRVVTALALCRLGDTWGVGACIRLGLKHEKYRPDVIKALEKVTGLAYGGNDEKWNEWFKNRKEY